MIIVIYRQPDDSTHGHPSTNKELSEAFSKINSFLADLPSPTPDIVMMGDMNLPHITPETWINGCTKQGIPLEETKMIECIKTMVDDFLLEQIVDHPTHKDGNLLDLLFTNNREIIHSANYDKTTYSDHHIITFKSTLRISKATNKTIAPDLPAAESFENLNFFSPDIN